MDGLCVCRWWLWVAVSSGSRAIPTCGPHITATWPLLLDDGGRGRGQTEANFHDSIKQALEAEFPDKNMGLGGVFRLRGADMHIHVMDYVPTEPATQDDLIGRLKRFEVPAGDLTNMTTIVTNTSEGSLRPKNNPHTHCFGTKEGVVGGHYHWDMDADAAEYEGFFVLAHTFVVAEQEKASA